jgi:lipoate-protein ligase A
MSGERPRWRLIADGDLRGARNMARDVAVLEAVARDEAPPTLRLYGWDPPCLTLGRHQGTEAADLDFCRSEGIDVVRRPTGGRALLHHLELTYSVVAPLGRGPMPHQLQEAYRRICEPLVAAMRSLGVDAELTGGEVNLQLPGPRSTVPCFEAPAGGEVVVQGRKLIGSAMRAHHRAILQHGAILLDWDERLQAGSMGIHGAGDLRSSVTTLNHETERDISRQELRDAVVGAVESTFAVALVAGTYTDWESRRSRELTDSFVVAG